MAIFRGFWPLGPIWVGAGRRTPTAQYDELAQAKPQAREKVTDNEPACASSAERKSRGRLLPPRQATADRPSRLLETTLCTTASSDRTHRRYFSPFGLAMRRQGEIFCSRVIAKLRVLVAIDPSRSGSRRRPLATRSRGETGKCQDRLAPGKAMQLRATRLESPRVLALDAIDAEEDDETGAERRRKAEHGQTRSGIVSQYWDKCPNIGTSRNQV